MYGIIQEIIDHVYTQGDSAQQYIYYVCGVLIPIFAVSLIDAVRFVFRAFLGRRR